MRYQNKEAGISLLLLFYITYTFFKASGDKKFIIKSAGTFTFNFCDINAYRLLTTLLRYLRSYGKSENT